MTKNNPQYETGIDGKIGEIVVTTCTNYVHIRCIDGLDAVSVFLHPDQVQELVRQLEGLEIG